MVPRRLVPRRLVRLRMGAWVEPGSLAASGVRPRVGAEVDVPQGPGSGKLRAGDARGAETILLGGEAPVAGVV